MEKPQSSAEPFKETFEDIYEPGEPICKLVTRNFEVVTVDHPSYIVVQTLQFLKLLEIMPVENHKLYIKSNGCNI